MDEWEKKWMNQIQMKEAKVSELLFLSMPNSASETLLQLHGSEGWMGISTTDNSGTCEP